MVEEKKNNKAAIRSGHLAGVANHTSLISTATHWRTEHWEYSQEFHLHPRYKVCLEAKSQVLVTTVRQWREVTVVPVKHSTTEESFYYRVSYTDFLSSLCLLCTKKKQKKRKKVAVQDKFQSRTCLIVDSLSSTPLQSPVHNESSS